MMQRISTYIPDAHDSSFVRVIGYPDVFHSFTQLLYVNIRAILWLSSYRFLSSPLAFIIQ